MNVLVADNAAHVRKRLLAMLRVVPQVNVIGEADRVRDAVARAIGGDADAVVLDLHLENGNGLDVLSAVRAERPATRFIVLSNAATDQHRRASLRAGADVFLDKTFEFARVPEILRAWIDSPSNG